MSRANMQSAIAERSHDHRSVSVAVRRRVGAFTLDVSRTFGAGITALVGPSGAGKTLTLRMIAGLLRPESGRITLGERVLFDDASGVDVPARARRVGYVFQQYALFPHLTVAANIAYGMSPTTAENRDARVAELLAMMQLDAFGARKPRELSGGQQQRVALARALAPSPELLLLDEPMAALDAPLRRETAARLRVLHEASGTPMLIVTHDPDEAARVADAVVAMQDGRIADG